MGSPMPRFPLASWMRSQKNGNVRTIRKKATRSSRAFRLEELENRLAPAAIPAAIVNSPGEITVTQSASPGFTPLFGFSPSVAQDPVNTAKMFEVHTNAAGSLLGASYSTNGGQTWTGFLNVGNSAALQNIFDPTTTSTRFPNLDH